MRRLLLVIMLSVFTTATTSAAQERTSQRPTNVAMVASMEQHYRPAIRAHDALIHGDLAEFRQQLTDLASVPLPTDSPPLWEPFEQQLHMAARTGAGAENTAMAAKAMAAVALACGVCHQSVAEGPVYPTPPADASSAPLTAQMRSHELSTLLLWNGVTGPSEFAWQTGAAGVAASRIFADTGAAAHTGQSLRAQEAALKALAAEARTTTVLAARAGLYGRMLVTCGQCHKAVDIKLPRP